jgi:protein-tyrosine-phosphatase
MAFPSRRSFLLAAIAAPTSARATPAPCVPQRVLFVCPAGAVKSAIAREVLRQRARSSNLRIVVESRGLQPEDHVSPALAANLRADGLDPAAEPALLLTKADVDRAHIVVAFDEAAHAPALTRARAWDIPSWNSDYGRARAALAVRMDALVAELRSGGRDCAGAGR